MGATKEMAQAIAEAENFKTDKTTEMSPSDITKIKEIQQDHKDLKLNTVGKSAVITGYVHKIDKLNSKYGHSYRISLTAGESVYYLNCKTEDACAKLFKVGEKTAFTINEKPNRYGTCYKIIEQVLYTF